MDFVEVSILLAIAAYTAPLSSLGPILKPALETAGEIPEDLGIADDIPPPYNPYIAPDYTARPWFPRMAMRAAAPSKWRARAPRVHGEHVISF